MAIQGIIKGFSKQIGKDQNLILFGRGDRYVLVEDGLVAGGKSDLEAAISAFDEALAKRYESDAEVLTWRAVLGTRTGSLGVTWVSDLSGTRSAAEVLG